MPKRYIVSGRANVHGHQPGETFLADLDPAHEARMLQGGFLALAADETEISPQETAENAHGLFEQRDGDAADELDEATGASEETPSKEG